MKRTFIKKPITAGADMSARPNSARLIDMYESGVIGSETMIVLINSLPDDEIREFMISEGLVEEE